AELDRIAGNFTPAIAAAEKAPGIAPAPGPVPAAAAPPAVPTGTPRPHQKPEDVPSGSGMNKVEVAEGKDLRVRFYGRRCIHARHCVLQAPLVFKANTPGEWIFPDAMSTDTVLRVAYLCPSGAIQFDRKDG